MARHPSDMQSRNTRQPAPPTREHEDAARPPNGDLLVAPPQTGRVRYGVVPARPRKRKVPLGAGPGLGAAGAGNFPDFLYRGGPVIANPQVHVVFLGDWSAMEAQTRATDLQQFIGDLLNSDYMNMLAQYGVGTSGTMAGAVFISETNDSITDANVQGVIQTAITGGTLPEPVPGSSICFMVYLDDNIIITDEQICTEAFGYHSHFQTTAGNPCFYGIIAGLTDTCLNNACGGDDIDCNLHLAEAREARQTEVTSHELTEMITNPNVALTLTDTRTESWCRPLNAAEVSPHENGDICSSPSGAGTLTVSGRTWTVQVMYSKWDDMNSNGATTCVTGSSFPLPSLLPVVTLVLDRSTFGKDEISAYGAVATIPDALYLVLDGYTPNEFGLTAGNLNAPPTFWAFSGTFPALSTSGVAISLDATTGVQLEDATNLQVIQRITVPFNITFTGTAAFNSIPANPGFQDFTIAASVTTNGIEPNPTFTRSSETAEIELVLQADPFMSAGETWWLSNDMRVFTVTPATLPPSNIPLQYSTTAYTSDPNTYVKALIDELNTNFTDTTIVNTPFNAITADEDQSALQLAQNESGNAVFNFGLARVHLKGDTAMNVRTFFRLFIASSPDTTYDQSTTYRELPRTDGGGNPIAGTLIPVIGFHSGDMASTLPFFAEPRLDPTANATTRQSDPHNVQTIPSPLAPTPPTGAEVYAYFGCYLDINQPTPQFPLNPATASTQNGPWTSAELQPIPAIIMGTHACLVAEIAYDPDPIPSGASPATSDKLGQRNLAWVGGDNPGGLAAHRIPALFDLAPTRTLQKETATPDELMIDWGNTPAGAPAAIYFPQVRADVILDLSRRLYARPQLTKLDANTVRCITDSVTYVPIPPGTGPNFSGLITVDLPSTVRTGQQFTIVVRRISRRLETPVIGDAQQAFNWRYVTGAFQINIPIGTGHELLRPEENLLAVFKWKLEQIPPTNRWYPTLQRFIDQVSGRVQGFGGNPQTIPPSQAGLPEPGTKSGHPGLPPGDLEYCGKITGLVYDRFGDFEGFTMETNEGRDETFRSEEDAIEDLVRRAWLERWVVAVIVHKHARHVPVSIVIRRAPRS